MRIRFYLPRSVALMALSAVVLVTISMPARAGMVYTYVTPTTANDGDKTQPVSAQAIITLNTNTVTIDLANTLKMGIKSMGQVLTGITVTYGASLEPTAITSSSGEVVQIGSTGIVTVKVPDPQAIDSTSRIDGNGWNLTGSFLSVFGTGGPNFGLLDYQTDYTSANGSIMGNTPHNPFTDRVDSFTLSAPGMTSGGTIKSVLFQFGTTVGKDTVTGNMVPPSGGTPVPEPSSLALCSIALAGLAWRRLRPRSIL